MRTTALRHALPACLAFALFPACAANTGEDTGNSEEDLSGPATDHATGLSTPFVDPQGASPETPEEAATVASAAVHDWAQAGYATPVKDQGQCGSCWAFATVEALESSTLVQWHQTYSRHPIDYSPQEVVSCDHSNAWGCKGGVPDSAVRWVSQHGLVDASQDPYKARNESCPGNLHPDVYVKRWGLVHDDVQSLKNAIQAHGPIISDIYASRAFEGYTGGVFKGGHPDATKLNHAVVITGWDDGLHAFRIRNSWGTGWGERGYAWIEYGTQGLGQGAVWVQSIDYR